MLFDKIVGQQKVIAQLKQAVEMGKPPQALLFLGPEGNGALPLAMAFAEFINTYPSVDYSDTKISRLVHPDVHLTFPVIAKKSGEKPVSTDFIKEFRDAYVKNSYLSYGDWMRHIAEGKQGNITARECREIVRTASLKAYQAPYKIHIIWCADVLGKESNILLKVIEEPPPKTVFILIANDQEKILSTIISRTQIVRVGKIDALSIQKGLIEKNGLETTHAERIAGIADGNFNYALQLTEQDDIPHEEILRKWLTACFVFGTQANADRVKKMFDSIGELDKLGKEELKAFLQYTMMFLRGLLAVSMEVDAHLQPAEIDYAKNLLKKLTFDDIYQLSDWMNDLSYQVERNVNVRLMLMDVSMRMAAMIRAKAVA